MKKYSLFEILGPVMIGPSSSHTAGAVRLGNVARGLSRGKISEVRFNLHGSFAQTYRGHGTDRALVAGILGLGTGDEGIRDALKTATDEGLKFSFHETDLGDVHPNTVEMEVTEESGRTYSVMGSSLGGGNINISRLNGVDTDFSGSYPTLIIKHTDIPGVVSEVTGELYDRKINIAFMKVFRDSRGRGATMIFEVDNPVPDEVVDKLRTIKGISSADYLNVTEV